MERSGSQKVLLVLSIISIVFAVLGILAGLMSLAGGVLFGAADPEQVADVLADTGVTQSQAGAAIGILGGSIIISCVIELIIGILGVRAANDARKIMPVWVLAIIQLVFSVLGLVASIVNGSFGADAFSIVITLIFAVLIFWISNNIKQQAGR